MDLSKVEAEVRSAVERMEAANTAIQAADADADLDTLKREFDTAEAEHTTAKERLERAKAVAEARAAAPVEPVAEVVTPKAGEIVVGSEPLTYERGNKNSYFRDLYRATKSDGEAQERLQRHGREMVEQRTNPNSTDGQGGEFIPPVWMQNEWVKIAKAGRAVADSLNKRPLPDGTDTINLPTVSGASSAAVQTDAGAVSSTDMTTSSVTGAVQTIAGQQDVSQQLVDLSVPGIEEVVFDDLVREYAKTLDTKVINGTVTNAKGLLQLSSTNSVSYTDASPTVPELYPKFQDGIQQIHTGRYMPPSVIAMHPRRWAWILASLDSNNRPLVVPNGPGFNAVGVLENVASESVVGNIGGLPVIVDANIPATNGASTNEDAVLIYRAEDLYLFESAPKFRVFGEVLSNTLQVRFQAYGYYAIIAGRYPKAISKITGTGLAAPTF